MTDATATGTDRDPGAGDEKRHELVAAVILGLAATLTAVAAFFSAAAGGDASNLRTDSGRTLADANFFFQRDTQTFTADQGLFVEYATANFQGESDRADYLTTLMRPELQAAVAWWNASDEAETPFDDIEGNPYYDEGSQADLLEANRLQEVAEAQVAEADEKDEQASSFDLATVLLAMTLFFAGIATLFERRSVVRGMLGVGSASLVAGAAVFLTGLSSSSVR